MSASARWPTKLLATVAESTPTSPMPVIISTTATPRPPAETGYLSP
jgi:hypothetical protein